MAKIGYIGKCLLVEERGERVLVVGDLHLGYEEALNKSGVFISRKMFEEMVKYFEGVFEKVGRVDKVVLLGDVKHVFGEILKQEWGDVLDLFDYLLEKCEEVIIVKGNHDSILEPIVKKKEDVKMVDYFCFGSVCFCHGDRGFEEMERSEMKTWVMGHGHPAVKISDGVKVEKYKCFLVGRYKRREVVVVPSFFEYNQGSDPRENELGLAWKFNLDKFRVKVVDGEFNVLDFGKLREID